MREDALQKNDIEKRGKCRAWWKEPGAKIRQQMDSEFFMLCLTLTY
jgi:hypothetical protein